MQGKNESNFLVNSVDHNGQPIKIICEGVDDNELSHFGGLDLHVKAVKTLINNTNGMSFAEKEGDYLIKDKVIALYLNEIGQFLRDSSIHDYPSNVSNTDLVKEFLEHWDENKEVVQVVDRDNDRIKVLHEE